MSHRKSDLGIPCREKSAKVVLGRVLINAGFGRMSALGVNRTRRDGRNDVNDPGCVKTHAVMKCSFYARSKGWSFYTAKAQLGHCRLGGTASNPTVESR